MPQSLSARLDIALEALPTYAFRSWTSVFLSPASIQSNGPRTIGTTRTNPPNVPHVFRWQSHGSHLPVTERTPATRPQEHGSGCQDEPA